MIQQQWQQYLERSGAGADSGPPGLAYPPELAALRFAGANARNFLQGYLTCDTADLQPGVLAPTALCSLKGRVVMNGWCTPTGEEDVWLVLHESLVDAVMAFLKPYLMFSRSTTLTDHRSDRLILAGLDLPQGGPHLPQGGPDLPRTPHRALVMDERRCLFVIEDLATATALWEHHPHLAAGTWLAALTADGIPLVSRPVSETFLPQMLDLDTLGAVDFEKGCYLGQEVVARAQHRGQVKRRLARLIWEGPAAPAVGADIADANGRTQGVVLQSAPDGATSGPLLAVLREQAPDRMRQGDTLLRRVG